SSQSGERVAAAKLEGMGSIATRAHRSPTVGPVWCQPSATRDSTSVWSGEAETVRVTAGSAQLESDQRTNATAATATSAIPTTLVTPTVRPRRERRCRDTESDISDPPWAGR